MNENKRKKQDTELTAAVAQAIVYLDSQIKLYCSNEMFKCLHGS